MCLVVVFQLGRTLENKTWIEASKRTMEFWMVKKLIFFRDFKAGVICRWTISGGMLSSGWWKIESKTPQNYQVHDSSYCWWFRNPANQPVEVGSLSHYLYTGFFKSQVVSRISSINSITSFHECFIYYFQGRWWVMSNEMISVLSIA